MDQQGRRGPGDQQRNPGGSAPGSKRRSPQIRGAALQGRRGQGQRCSGGAKGPGADGPRMRRRLPRPKLQAPPSSLPTLSTGQLSPFPSQIASIASFVGGRPLFPAPPSVPARFPAARSISLRSVFSRSPPLFPAWGLMYGARLIQLDTQSTPMDA